MKKSIEKKHIVVLDIIEKIKNSKSVIMTDYRGLTVSESTELRKQLSEKNIKYKVFKNNLIQIAFDDLKIEGVDIFLKGPTAIAFSENDILSSKILFNFSKEHESLKIKGGLIENEIILEKQLKILSELPSRDMLLSQLAFTLAFPMKKIILIFNSLFNNLFSVINLIKEKKEKIS